MPYYIAGRESLSSSLNISLLKIDLSHISGYIGCENSPVTSIVLCLFRSCMHDGTLTSCEADKEWVVSIAYYFLLFIQTVQTKVKGRNGIKPDIYHVPGIVPKSYHVK